MRIGKSQFIEYLRCPRFSALDDISANSKDSFVNLDDIEFQSELYYKNVEKLETSIEDIELDPGTLEIMMPQFNEIEILVGSYLKEKFGFEVINSLITNEQLKLECDYEDAQLFGFVDVFQKTDVGFNLCEVKAKTTNTIWKLGKQQNASDKEANVSVDYKSIFTKCDDGIVRLRDEIEGFSFKDFTLSEKEFLTKKAQLYNHETDIGRIVLDLSFQRFVAEKMYGVSEGNKYYLGLINNEYVFNGTYKNNQPDYVCDEKGNDIVVLVDLTTITKDMQDKVEMLLNKVINYIEEGNASPCRIGNFCLRKKSRQCKYYSVCWENIPKTNSIFAYIGNHQGFKNADGVKFDRYDLIADGKVSMLDVNDDILHRYNNVIQKKCVVNDEEFVDKRKINSAIKVLSYPIYHLDFESLPLPLPRFKGEKCYTQSLFQFSVHIEHAPGVCDKQQDHHDFLSTDHNDNRLALAQKLLDVIKDDGGSIMVYNKSFEMGRIKELASYFPKLRSELLKLNDRIIDLMDFVKGNTKFYASLGYEDKNQIFNYYHPNLNGSYSIKSVLPVFSDLTYKGMDVGNGTDAMMTYAKYFQFSSEEFKQKTNALVEYCKQDTWAMVVILEELRKLIE